MARFIKDRNLSKGQAPGAPIFLGRKKMEKPAIRVMDYTTNYLDELELESIEEVIPYLEKESVSWINIFGIHDTQMMQRLGEILSLDSLFVEDILNTDQMPVYHDGESYDGFILKMLTYDSKQERVHADQVTLILGRHFVISLQEITAVAFEPVRVRIRNHKGRVRLNNNDYLLYALMDTLADHYLFVVERMGLKIESLESMIFDSNDKKLSEKIYRNKIELSYVRKNIRPIKDIMLQVWKSENTYFAEGTQSYLRDLTHLITEANESIELYGNMVSDQLNTYNTIVNNRMNEVMKVLTVFASIFIPLTFIAGVYGMNFEYIPELKYRYSYFIFWAVILLIGFGLVIYFRRKRWL